MMHDAVAWVFVAIVPIAWLAAQWRAWSRAEDEARPRLGEWLWERLRAQWPLLVLLMLVVAALPEMLFLFRAVLVGLADSLLGHMK